MIHSDNPDLTPDIISFNTAISAVVGAANGTTKEKQIALEIGHEVFAELKKSTHCRPDSVTYTSMLKITTLLRPPTLERQAAIADLFRMCCQDGVLDDRMVRQVRLNMKDDAMIANMFEIPKYDRNLPDKALMQHFPSSWTRNAKNKRRR